MPRHPRNAKTRPSWAAEQAHSLSAITGKSAGMIEITSENSTFRKRMVFMRCELRAYRSELMNDSVKFSRSLVDCIWRGFHCNTARATTRNARNAMRNGAPSSGSSKPPRAGPTMPERFSCTPPSVIAEGSSSLLTMSGTMAPQTGAPNASPIPSAKMQTSTALGLIASVHAPRARSAEQAACHKTALTITPRRFTMSATTPAGSVNRKNGAEAAVAMRESENDGAPR